MDLSESPENRYKEQRICKKVRQHGPNYALRTLHDGPIPQAQQESEGQQCRKIFSFHITGPEVHPCKNHRAEQERERWGKESLERAQQKPSQQQFLRKAVGRRKSQNGSQNWNHTAEAGKHGAACSIHQPDQSAHPKPQQQTQL